MSATNEAYENFINHYKNACIKWESKLDDIKGLPKFYLPFSKIRIQDYPLSILAANFERKSVSLFLRSKENTFTILWEDEYETIDKLEQDWFTLDASALRARHAEELIALFGDYIYE